jgi:hypothetical protein
LQLCLLPGFYSMQIYLQLMVFQGYEFPGSEGPMAYIVFNPASTVPPVTTIIPHSGTKMVASFAATTPPNNDWLIAPRVNLGTNAALKFYAKSHTPNMVWNDSGLEYLLCLKLILKVSNI